MPLERLEVLENLEALGFTLIFRGPLLGDLAMPLERLEVLENLEVLGFTLICLPNSPPTWRFWHAFLVKKTLRPASSAGTPGTKEY